MAVSKGQKLTRRMKPVLRPCSGGCGVEVVGATRRSRLCGDCRTEMRRDVRKRHYEKRKTRADYERPFLREQHGMTELDYARMLVAQDGRCAGCNRAAPVRGKALNIDHDHRCHPQGGRSCERCRRGLLCAECNRALGLAYDDPETLERLAAYLRKWGA